MPRGTGIVNKSGHQLDNAFLSMLSSCYRYSRHSRVAGAKDVRVAGAPLGFFLELPYTDPRHRIAVCADAL